MAPRSLTFFLSGSVAVTRARADHVMHWIEKFALLSEKRGFSVTVRTTKPSTGSYSARALRQAQLFFLQAGPFNSLALDIGGRDSGGGFAWWWGKLGVRDVSSITFGLTFGQQQVCSLHEFVRLCWELVDASGLSVGHVVSSALPDRLRTTDTELELKAHAAGAPFGPQARERYIPGYGWALWLTEGHIASLGGRERVQSEAPVCRAVERPQGMWLELTDDPWDVSEGVLARLEAYLDPVRPDFERLRRLAAPETSTAHSSAFVMVIDTVAGFQGVQVVGISTGGALPSSGDRVYVTVGGAAMLEAKVVHSRSMGGGRVLIGLDGVDPVRVVPGERLSTDVSSLAGRGPTATSLAAVDAGPHPDQRGPIRWERLPDLEDAVSINVHLTQPPSAKAALALDGHIRTWYSAGCEGAFPPGGFHSLNGPHWNGTTATWSVDLGPADQQMALDDLMKRLAEWAGVWDCPVEAVRVGAEPL